MQLHREDSRLGRQLHQQAQGICTSEQAQRLWARIQKEIHLHDPQAHAPQGINRKPHPTGR